MLYSTSFLKLDGANLRRMDLHVRLEAGLPVGRQIYSQIREAIVGGRLRPGDRLPATRALAARLSVSRNMVVWAYELLAAEGFIESRIGAGSVVATGAGTGRTARPAGPLTARPLWRALTAPRLRPGLTFDFRIGAPDGKLFPEAEWRRLLARELRTGVRPADPGEPGGERRLREAIARHAAVSRAIACRAADVIVTAGAQQAFDLIARCLVGPGDVVAIEDPGYPLGRLAFEAAGARIAAVRVDTEGLVVDELPDRAKLVFVTPSHQFPTGVPMSMRRRQALLAWASRSGAAIVEDDYNGEFRFDGRPLEPLQRLDAEGRVIFVGSFSKTLHPSLRLGYLVAPKAIRADLLMAKLLSDVRPPAELQGALAALLETGELAAHVRRLRATYGKRRAVLLQALAGQLPALSVRRGVAGLHLGVALPIDRPTAEAAAAAAQAAEVSISPWSDFAVRSGAEGLAIGFGAIDAERIAPGVQRLAEAIRSVS